MPSAPDISLIVVFHNAETTIERTLRSLNRQSLTSVEYIFVNDGSTDRTVEVVQDFLALNPGFAGRHRLVSTPVRRGSAHATTLGIAHATGEYVMRCDADDYLDRDALNIMLRATDGKRHDVVMAPYYAEEGKKNKVVGFRRRPSSLNDMPVDTLNFSLCNKLLRRKMLDDNGIAPYDGLDCWEDLGVVSRVMSLKPSVGFTDIPVYHYVKNPASASLSRSSRGRLLEDHLAIALLVEQWMVEHDMQEEYDAFLNNLKFCAKVKMLRGRDKDVRRWLKTFPEVNSHIMELHNISLHWRLLFTAVAKLPAGFTQWVADLFDIFYPREKAVAPTRQSDTSRDEA